MGRGSLICMFLFARGERGSVAGDECRYACQHTRSPCQRAIMTTNSGSGVRLFVLIGLVPSPFVGAMVFLITCDEYPQHGFERVTPSTLSLEAALVSIVAVPSAVTLAGPLLVSRRPAKWWGSARRRAYMGALSVAVD